MSRLIVGLQPVREAIRAHGDKLEAVWVEASRSPQLEAVARFAQDHGAPLHRVPRAELDRRAKGGRHQGVLALAPALRLLSLAEVKMPADGLFLALDELEDPQNFGAILRSAVALGAHAVLWPEHHSAPLSPATFRASAGAVEHARLVRVRDLKEALEDLRGRGAKVVGLDAAAEVELAGADLTGPSVLVVGAEGKGLRKSVKRCCDTLAKLPMGGPVASLNASVAVALALYEAKRQRGRVTTLTTPG